MSNISNGLQLYILGQYATLQLSSIHLIQFQCRFRFPQLQFQSTQYSLTLSSIIQVKELFIINVLLAWYTRLHAILKLSDHQLKAKIHVKKQPNVRHQAISILGTSHVMMIIRTLEKEIVAFLILQQSWSWRVLVLQFPLGQNQHITRLVLTCYN